jgi:hypothetical protein
LLLLLLAAASHVPHVAPHRLLQPVSYHFLLFPCLLGFALEESSTVCLHGNFLSHPCHLRFFRYFCLVSCAPRRFVCKASRTFVAGFTKKKAV